MRRKVQLQKPAQNFGVRQRVWPPVGGVDSLVEALMRLLQPSGRGVIQVGEGARAQLLRRGTCRI